MTPHFTLAELTFTEHREFDNTPNAAQIANLNRLALLLEDARALLGKPLMINSAFRSKAVNTAVGSKSTSQHLLGCAADFRVPGMTPNEVVKALIALPYDQIIREFDAWVHISVPSVAGTAPRRNKLIIDKAGVRVYE
jgi:zinc D-Ala-D-Ala carboxypeptidase